MVQRHIEGGYDVSEMEEDNDGGWVTYEDYQKLEAELEQLRQQVKESAADGWIEWGGGECPVGVGCVVDVKWSDGTTNLDREGSHWRWANWACGPNIVAYRIVRN